MLVQIGDVFRAGDAVVLFVTIDQKADDRGERTLPLNRVELGVGSQVETMPVLSGACRTVDPAATWRAETVCEADTIKGRFEGASGKIP